MAFWDRLRKKTPEWEERDTPQSMNSSVLEDRLEQQQSSPDMQSFYELAIKHGSGNGYTMDFSDSSMNAVEQYLEREATRLKQREEAGTDSKETMAQIYWGTAYVWGAYVGEALLRNHLTSFSWRQGEDGVPILSDASGENQVSPVSKVYKRITSMDPGESVEGFYNTAITLLGQSN